MDKSYKEIYTIKDKEYWLNFWFFNKYSIIAIFIALVMIISGITRCTGLKRPDAGIIIITSNNIDPEKLSMVNSRYSELINDVNGDKEVTLNIIEISFSKNAPDEVEAANTIRTNNEVLNGDSSVVIGEYELIKQFFQKDGVFAKPFESEFPVILSTSKNPVALDITNSRLAEIIGYSSDSPLCLAYMECDENLPIYPMYEEGKIIAREISGNK